MFKKYDADNSKCPLYDIKLAARARKSFNNSLSCKSESIPHKRWVMRGNRRPLRRLLSNKSQLILVNVLIVVIMGGCVGGGCTDIGQCRDRRASEGDARGAHYIHRRRVGGHFQGRPQARKGFSCHEATFTRSASVWLMWAPEKISEKAFSPRLP
eukprot:6935357-Pyramimonas_sp.AAC.1